MLWPVTYFYKIANALAKNSKFVAVAMGFIVWVTNLIDNAVTFVTDQITDALTSIDLSAFTNISFNGLEGIGVINAIVPVSEFLIMFSAYLVAWLTIIVIRWIKSFVPTIAN